MTPTIFSYGYRGRSPDELVRLAEKLDATVIDTRHRPWSRWKQWSQPNLQRRLGSRYVHVKGFGNLNWDKDLSAPVLLVDVEAGLRQVGPLLERGSILVLCMCPHHDECHRKDVVDRIASKFSAPVVLLGADAGPLEVVSRTQIPLL